jgi:predicted Zn-dependent protease
MANSTKAKLFLLGFLILVMFAPQLHCQNKTDEPKDTQKAQEQKKGKDKKKPKNKKDDVDEIGNRDVGKGVNMYSIEKEIGMGKQLAQQIEKQVKLVEDPVIAEYVNRIGQNLVRNSDSKVPFTIKVIDTEEPNAVSLPGGFFFVNSGLIVLADNEAELAGAMAHEIAHVAARHGTRQATRGQIVNIATIPLIFMGGWAGYGVQNAIGLIVPLGFMQFSRAFEREADSLGLQYLYKAGYDPLGMVEMFEKLEKMEKTKPGTLAKIFSTHPMSADRVVAAQKEIQDVLPAKSDYVITTSEFLDIKARLNQMLNRARPQREKEQQSGRPTLRKAPPSGTIEPGDKGQDNKTGDDEPPVLKRR